MNKHTAPCRTLVCHALHSGVMSCARDVLSIQITVIIPLNPFQPKYPEPKGSSKHCREQHAAHDLPEGFTQYC